MLAKKCYCCKVEKPFSSFSVDKSRKDGLYTYCKECCKERNIANKEKYKESQRKYREKNIEKIKAQSKIYVANNKEKRRLYLEKYAKENAHIIKEGKAKYQKNNIDKIRIKKREYREKNKEKISLNFKEYVLKNREKINAQKREYTNRKRKEDLRYKTIYQLKSKTTSFFKRKTNVYSQLLGCDLCFAKDYFEKLFKEGMSWDNHGEWHIDHIIPMCSGQTEEDLIKLCHYTNLQPLWAKENIDKGRKILNETKNP